MTDRERLTKPSNDDKNNGDVVGYCDEGVEIRSEDGAATDEFAVHVEECPQCSVLLETEKPGEPIE